MTEPLIVAVVLPPGSTVTGSKFCVLEPYALLESIDSNNSINQTQYTLDDTRSRDYVVYFDRNGNLTVSYYLEPMQMYYFISLS